MNEYPEETLDSDEDNGTMPESRDELAAHVIGHRIHSATQDARGFVLTLDDGRQVIVKDTSDCCAYTEVRAFLLHPELVDHVIMGVGTTDDYSTWHIYADAGDILELTVDWSAGNPFYYAYGFGIEIAEAPFLTDAELDYVKRSLSGEF